MSTDGGQPTLYQTDSPLAPRAAPRGRVAVVEGGVGVLDLRNQARDVLLQERVHAAKKGIVCVGCVGPLGR